MSALVLSQLKRVPLVKQGDDLPAILLACLLRQGIDLRNGDILAVTSKIVSKAEGRLVNLQDVTPSATAIALSNEIRRDVRLVELILSESRSIIRATERAFIVEHNNGFICANAGIDHSNVQAESGGAGDWYLLLPKDPDQTARKISDEIRRQTMTDVGVIIVDSHGRPWRKGTVGVVIGAARVPTLVDLRGQEDLFGYKLKITMVAAADELASAASLMMGQAAEKIPAVHIRGFPYSFTDSSIKDVLRTRESDLFR